MHKRENSSETERHRETERERERERLTYNEAHLTEGVLVAAGHHGPHSVVHHGDHVQVKLLSTHGEWKYVNIDHSHTNKYAL